MKITKYGQSCFLIESKDTKVYFDPGNLTSKLDIQNIDAVFYSHKHSDHYDLDNLKLLLENNPVMKVFASSEVCDMIKKEGLSCISLSHDESVDVKNVKVVAVKAVHGHLPLMKGKTVKSNNGYIFDGEFKVWHTSDTISFEHDYQADILLLPVCGHGVVMDARVAVEFAQDINPKLVIPMHYESDKHKLGTDDFEKYAKKLNYKILENGETYELHK